MTAANAEIRGRSQASDAAARIRDGFDRWMEYRRTVAELQALSNRTLSDLGYVRGDLRAIARRDVYGE